MTRPIAFWATCVIAFIFWKVVFATDFMKVGFKAVATSEGQLSSAQIKQIEEIARNIADQSNSNKQQMLDEITSSFNAVATGRNVRFEYVLLIKKGLPQSKIKEWFNVTKSEILQRTCAQNEKNPAFDRGLSYTFSYSNGYGEKLGEIFVDKAVCKQ